MEQGILVRADPIDVIGRHQPELSAEVAGPRGDDDTLERVTERRELVAVGHVHDRRDEAGVDIVPRGGGPDGLAMPVHQPARCSDRRCAANERRRSAGRRPPPPTVAPRGGAGGRARALSPPARPAPTSRGCSPTAGRRERGRAVRAQREEGQRQPRPVGRRGGGLRPRILHGVQQHVAERRDEERHGCRPDRAGARIEPGPESLRVQNTASKEPRPAVSGASPPRHRTAADGSEARTARCSIEPKATSRASRAPRLTRPARAATAGVPARAAPPPRHHSRAGRGSRRGTWAGGGRRAVDGVSPGQPRPRLEQSIHRRVLRR
jgi:hypothetical protein